MPCDSVPWLAASDPIRVRARVRARVRPRDSVPWLAASDPPRPPAGGTTGGVVRVSFRVGESIRGRIRVKNRLRW